MKNWITMTESFLNITLEIIYLLAGETPRPEVHRSSGCNISNSPVNAAVLTSQTRIEQEPNSCDATTSTIFKEKSNSDKRGVGGTNVPTASLTRQTQCNSTLIKEESISCEENNVASPSSPMHIEYLSVTVKEEYCEDKGSGLSDSDNEATQEADEKLGFPECEAFSSIEELIRYQASDLDSKGSECLECGKFFSKKCNLRVHQRSHRGEKPFSCAECKQSFSVKSTLVRHLRIHSGEKPFACPICGKCFRQSQSLVAHQRSHTGEKPFTCPVCEKSFSSSQYLVAHKRSHTGERPYPCPECGKCFGKKPMLVIHRRIHSGKKPYICPDCGKCFIWSSALAIHQKTHVAGKHYPCPECGKFYRSRKTLMSHMKYHSLDQIASTSV